MATEPTDPLQTSAINALAPFLALAPSATSPRAAADLVSQATSAPNTYIFAELLQTSNVQALKNAEEQHARWYRVLEIFCWGTWEEYQWLPELNEPQTLKLRLLTILTLARSPSNLTYPALQNALTLPSPASLESLLTTAIYAGLVTAKLNPLKQRVDVASVAPLRDLEPNSVPQLARVLELWEHRCKDVLAEMEGRISEVKRGARERGDADAEWEERFESLVGEEKKNGKREGEVLEGLVDGRKSGRMGGLGIRGRYDVGRS